MSTHRTEVIDNTSVVLPNPFRGMIQSGKRGQILSSRPVIHRDEKGELYQLFGEDLKDRKSGPIEVVVVDNLTKAEQFRLISSLHRKHQDLVNQYFLRPFNIDKGDCLERLKLLPDNSIDSVVTDPPYHLTSISERFGKKRVASEKDNDGLFQRKSKGFMGKEWDGGDIAFKNDVWEECLRVLKPGGYLLAFSAARNYHRMASAIEDSGFEIRDQIMWIYGSGFPKSHNVANSIDKLNGAKNRGGAVSSASKFHPTTGKPLPSGKKMEKYKSRTTKSEGWEGWGTALKPAHEPIVVARKPLSEKSIASNVLKWRTGAINVDACRIPLEDCEELSVEYTNNRVMDTNGNGSGFKSVLIENQGRWPANLIFNDPPEENWSKYFYCSKASKKEKEFGTDILPEKTFSRVNNGGLNNDPRWADTLRKNIHPTVKPLKLMDHLVQMVTPKGGITLDPFMGSGSTGISAVRNGFRFIGIERESDYFELAKARMEWFFKKSD
jgi:DNA modification methylase